MLSGRKSMGPRSRRARTWPAKSSDHVHKLGPLAQDASSDADVQASPTRSPTQYLADAPAAPASGFREGQVPKPARCNESWRMDFISDQLHSGRPIRLLTIVDNYSRESLALQVGLQLGGDDVAQVLNRLIAERGTPDSIRLDNGPEFTS